MDLTSIIVVLVATFVGLIGALYAYGKAHAREIKDNWVKYRCNPIYMPMAGFVGSDIVTNFTNCTMKNVQSYTGFVMDPIYQNFRSFQEIFSTITKSMNDMRKMMAGTTNSFTGIISSTFGKIANTLGTTSQLVGRVRTLNKRIISMFVVMMHIANTGVKTGYSINNGPIGKTAEFFCFHPDTQIRLKNGETIAIKDVKPYMILEDDSHVFSILEFDGTQTPMVMIEDITVSGNHKILRNNEWIRAEDHPDAVQVESCERIFCLNTDTHKIPIGSYIFKDYEETDDVEEFHKDVFAFYDVPSIDRSFFKVTGFHPDTDIILEDGTIKPINKIHIGDALCGEQKVIGIVKHSNIDGFVELEEGIYCSPGTLLFDENCNLCIAHSRGEHPSIEIKENMYYQLLTEKSGFPIYGKNKKIMIALDDQEVPLSSIHSKRDAHVIHEKITDS